MRRLVPALALALGLLPSAPAQPPTAAKPVVKVVRYDGLTDFIKQQRGQVLVLDFWADYCIPCKREFPKLVALNGKYAKDGLTAVSVSLDDLTEEGAKDKVLLFLDKQKATFTNLILDEKPELWQSKLKIDGPPLVMVYNRKGELEQKFVDKDVEYGVIEKLVAELLKSEGAMTHDQALAAALGRVPSGLFILTVRQGERETGMLASWVQQCSFEPPQISVAVQRERFVHALLAEGGAFVVNVLAAGQTDLLKHFGKGFGPDEPAFTGLELYHTQSGVPVLSAALAHLDCLVAGRFSAGDHDLVIGQVVGGRLHSDGQPAVHVRKNGLRY